MILRRISALFLALALLLPSAVCVEESGMARFERAESAPAFSDVPESAWYAPGVRAAAELGLMRGRPGGVFDPAGDLSRAEAAALAARVHAIYHGAALPSGGEPWYQSAVEYAAEAGLSGMDPSGGLSAPATRAELARLFASALPAGAYPPINRISHIPDVPPGSAEFEAVYLLYYAGVLTGGVGGAFRPGGRITRAEAAVLLSRAVLPALRVRFSLDKPAPGTVVAAADGGFRLSLPPGWRYAWSVDGAELACSGPEAESPYLDVRRSSREDHPDLAAADFMAKAYGLEGTKPVSTLFRGLPCAMAAAPYGEDGAFLLCVCLALGDSFYTLTLDDLGFTDEALWAAGLDVLYTFDPAL